MDTMTLAQFREEFTRVLESTEESKREGALMAYLTICHYKLPLFPDGHLTEDLWDYSPNSDEHYSDAFLYNNLNYCDCNTVSGPNSIFIDPLQTIGYTWLYDNDRSEGRPYSNRLAKILLGKPENLPELFAPRAGDFYECSDGNHRIYAAYLLGRKVKVECCEEYLKVFNAAGQQV